MTRLRPVPQTGLRPAGQVAPLAGSRAVWFNQITDLRGVPFHTLGPDATATLSTLRAAVDGITLDRPRIMGIVNTTPDSFSDGGRFNTLESAVAHAHALIGAGADILDIGGESTRPGASEVAIEEEIRRTAPVIVRLRAENVRTPISIDTRKAAVAQAALDAGATIVNDVSALTFDPAMAATVAKAGVWLCLMHAQGAPQTMQIAPHYADVTIDVCDFLQDRLFAARDAGIKADRLIVDPGIGFGKTTEHNLTLLRNLAVLHTFGCPILLGVSRKRFIGQIGRAEAADDRMPGSVAVALFGAAQGAQILRVHDVAETRQALYLWEAMCDPDFDTKGEPATTDSKRGRA